MTLEHWMDENNKVKMQRKRQSVFNMYMFVDLESE